MNTCYEAVDKHVDEGRGDQVAIIHDSPLTRTIRKITYRELQTEVGYISWTCPLYMNVNWYG